MKVEVLGCAGAAAPGMRTTAFRVGDRIAIDAGCLAQALPLEDQVLLRDVFVSHAHLDHIASLPLLLDNRMALGAPALRVHAGPQTLDALRAHVFNGVLWPTLDELNAAMPTAELHELRPGASVALDDGVRVEALEFVHTVPTLGFRVSQGERSALIGGDTGELGATQAQLAEGGVDLLLLEASWPRRLQELAALTGHMTPADLEGLDLPSETRLVVTHLKPAFQAEIEQELASSGIPHVVGRDGVLLSCDP